MPTTPNDFPEDPEIRRVRLTPRGVWAIIAVVALLVAAGGTALVTAGDEAPPLASGSEEPAAVEEPAAETPEEELGPTVFTDPGEFMGQPLDLWAKVVEVVDHQSFRIISESETDTSLLVVYSGDPKIGTDMALRVRGQILPWEDHAQIDNTLGVALLDSTYAASNDEYVLVAESVEIIGGQGKTEVAETDPAAAPPVTAASDPVITPASSTTTAPVSSAPAATAPSSGGGGSGSGSGGSGSGGSGSGGSGGSGSGSGSGSGGGAAASNGSSEIAYTGDSTSGQHTDEAEFEATLTGTDGDPIEGAKVTFEIRGNGATREFAARTDHKGVARRAEPLTETPGTYKLVVSYTARGDRTVADRTTFVVEKDDTVLELKIDEARGSDEEPEEGENGNDKEISLTGFLSDADSARGVGGRTVNFYADGQLIGSATTDEYGVATLDVPDGYNKNSDFEARFEGDDYYLSSADTA